MEVLYKKVFEKYNTSFYYNYNNIPTQSLEEIEVGEPFGEENSLLLELNLIRNASSKYPYFKFSSQTEKREDFEENYGNPLCSVHVSRLTLVVEKNEEKVSMKLFFLNKYRDVGRPYFRKQTKLIFVTYSFKTNDLYSGSITNGFKKRKNIRRLNKNYFGSKPIEMFFLSFKNNISSYLNKKENYLVNYNPIVCSAVDIFMQEVTKTEHIGLNWDSQLYKHYLENRGIKYPNNFVTFMSIIPIPSKRILKKSEYKLVDAVMLQNGLKGDKLRKILHETKSINLDFYKKTEKFFGEKFLRHSDEETLKKIISYKNGYLFPDFFERFSKKEKQNVFEIFKSSLSGEIHYMSFLDHLNFYSVISQFEEIKWKSNNISSFNKEHSEWTDKYEHYTHGTYYRYYNEKFVSEIKKVIEIGEEKFYPVLLTNSNEYNNESSVQNNCVKTYIDRPGSIIISLRKDTLDSTERATIEFRIGIGLFDKLVLRRRQTLGRFNRELDESWKEVIKKLDNKINESTKYFELPKVKVDYGREIIESESQFDEKKNFVEWVSPFINHLNNNFIFRLPI